MAHLTLDALVALEKFHADGSARSGLPKNIVLLAPLEGFLCIKILKLDKSKVHLTPKLERNPSFIGTVLFDQTPFNFFVQPRLDLRSNVSFYLGEGSGIIVFGGIQTEHVLVARIGVVKIVMDNDLVAGQFYLLDRNILGR